MPGARRRSLLLAAVGLAWPSVAAVEADGGSEDGQAAYEAHCASCHGSRLEGGFAPSLSDAAFKARWAGRAAALAEHVTRQMPPASPGALDPADYARITRMIVAHNRLGGGEMLSEGDRSGGQEAIEANEDAAAAVERERRGHLLAAMRPVDDAMLRSPPAADWLHWRRSYDAQGHSPLTGINRGNVRRTKLVWSLSLPAGTNQITPLVHDGVMFVDSAGTVMAIEAATGTLLWSHARPASVRPLGPPVSQPRGMAIMGSALIVPTLDNHVLALDAASGRLLWDHLIEASDGVLRLTGAPLVVGGRILQGVAGCAGARYPGGCFIVALDGADGRELWRFHTIARPGTRDGDSWNGAPLAERFGGSVWSAGSFDPSTGLVYFGAGQTYHIDPLMRPGGSNSDALYTDATLALDPEDGRLVWHYQHLARDVWDLDWSYERILATIRFRGQPHRVVMTMGKLGILDVLDAATGAWLFSRDLGLQDVVSGIDPSTGRKAIRPEAEPVRNVERAMCPFPSGVRNFPATSYDPARHMLFVPAVESCMTYVWRPGGDWDIAYRLLPRPGSDGKFGHLAAIALDGKPDWRARNRAPQSSATLSTASGLLFEGARDRMFRARDSATGRVLWSTRLSAQPNAFPISFAVDGRQFVAVTAGGGGPSDAAWQALTPEIRNIGGATTLFVFAPDGA